MKNHDSKPLSLEEFASLIEPDWWKSSSFFPSWRIVQNRNQSLILQEIWDFIDYNLRGVGQVIFLNNPISGFLILVALFFQSPWVGLMSLLGVIASTETAIQLKIDPGQYRNGIYGYNGVLVGAAFATFGIQGNGHWNFIWGVSVIIFSALTTVLLRNTSIWWAKFFKSPPLTLPFNLLTLLFLSSIQYITLLEWKYSPMSPIFPSQSIEGIQLLNSVFISFGQIFLADKLFVGILIFLAVAFCTPIGAIVGLLGSIAGLITGLVLKAPTEQLYFGIYGYNSILSAIAIGGVFYVPSKLSLGFGLISAFLTAITTQLLAILLGGFGLPILTLPFCIITISFFILLRQFPSYFAPVSLHAITNPEEHRYHYLEAKEAIFKFRYQLEGFMLNKPRLNYLNSEDIKGKNRFQYIFNTLKDENTKTATVFDIQQYLNQIEPSSIFPANLELIIKFINFNNPTELNFEEFCELILRYEYFLTKRKTLTSYFLPIDKHKNDPITNKEIRCLFASVDQTPLTKIQINLLHNHIRSNFLTWDQFITLLLVV